MSKATAPFFRGNYHKRSNGSHKSGREFFTGCATVKESDVSMGKGNEY